MRIGFEPVIKVIKSVYTPQVPQDLGVLRIYPYGETPMI